MNLSGLQLPSQKTWAAGVGGILGWSISLALHAFLHIDLGGQGDAALVTILAIALVKLVPPSKQDVLVHINDEIAQAGVIIGKLTPASDQAVPPTPAAKQLAAKVGPAAQ
jgi:hypothetical protein